MRSRTRLILVAGTGAAALTFQGVFLSGCGGVCGCYYPDASYDAASDAAEDGPKFGDASADAPSDASGDAPEDAEADSASDAPVDALSE